MVDFNRRVIEEKAKVKFADKVLETKLSEYTCSCDDLIDIYCMLDLLIVLTDSEKGNVEFQHKKHKDVFVLQLNRIMNRIRLTFRNDSILIEKLVIKRHDELESSLGG